MKRHLKPFVIALFAGTFFLNLSFDSQGKFSLLSNAEASAPATTTLPDGWADQEKYCSTDSSLINVCFKGTNKDCTPGTCPPAR